MAAVTSTFGTIFFLLKPNNKIPISTPFQLPFTQSPLKTPNLRHRHYQFTPNLCSSKPLPNVVEILEARGLLESLTGENLRSLCSDSSLRVYCGFDPTAQTLHLGNLIGIIVLSWFIRCGHSAVALVGGATGSLRDPELDLQTLKRNISGISSTIAGILTQFEPFDHPNGSIRVLNNYDWWKDVKLLDFLKNVGRFVRVNNMMAKQSVKTRLESSDRGLSYTEFTYQLLQGYDFVHLFETENVTVQIGGSDQWGNITTGTELVRKLHRSDSVYGLTFPLLLKSDGTKFGKSEEGAIWLSPLMLSPYEFYQYLLSVPDADVVRFLKIFTFLSLEEIHEIEIGMKGNGYVSNSAQRRLAEEVTRFVHGTNGLEEAVEATEALRTGSETRLNWKTIGWV